MVNFNDFGLSETVLENLKAKGYDQPTDVQATTIPKILEKNDVVIQSKTGSGKTAAFSLPIIQGIMADVPAVQYLILVPTRELAAQVRDEIISLAESTALKLCAIYGGVDMNKQIKKLRQGAQVVVGTPGRILDHLRRRTMSFSVVRGVVLDEADKMLSMGFLTDVQSIMNQLPKRRQVVMSSATFPYSIEALIETYMHDPVKFELSTDEAMPKEIKHYFCTVQSSEKEASLLAFLEKEQPEFSLIFCNTKVDVKSLHYFLQQAGMQVEELSSDMSQSQREKALKRLRLGVSRHMVCTDLAARGIDIPALSHVFNFSASNDAETYVHRTGRTGRAGNHGKAISLVSTLDLAGFQMALKTNGIDVEELNVPDEKQITQARVQAHYKHLESIDFAKDVDVRDEFSKLADSLTDDQIKGLLPLLLEQFRKPKVVVEPVVAQLLPPRSDSTSRNDREPRPKRDSRGRRDRGGRKPAPYRSKPKQAPGEKPVPLPPKRGSKPESGSGGKAPGFTTICLALGRLDGLDEMDIQNILRRQGKTRMGDIGDIAMKDHESFVNIGASSLENVLAADGKFFKSFELFITKSPIPL